MPLTKKQLDEIIKGSQEANKNNEDYYAQQAQQGLLDQQNQATEDTDTRGGFSKFFDQVNPLDSGRDWGRAKPSDQGAEKSVWQQGKEVASSLATGIEKTGDSVEALTGITGRRLDHWDQQLKDGKITREQYQTLLQNQIEDTKWAGDGVKEDGSIDQGFSADRFKKAAGVSLEATSEIVPFLKGAKAASLTLKGGAILGAGVGAAHSSGTELNNPEGFDWKNVAIQTTVGGALGGILGRSAQKTEEAKQFMRNMSTRQLLSQVDSPDPITDVSRLLTTSTDNARTSITSKISKIDEELNAIRTDPNYTTPKPQGEGTFTNFQDNPGATPTAGKVKADGTLDQRLNTSKTAGQTTAENASKPSNKATRARELMRERKALNDQLGQVDSASGPLERVTQINQEITDGQAAGTLTPKQAADLMSERQTILESAKSNKSPQARQNADWIEEQGNTNIRNQAGLDPNAPNPSEVPRASQRAANMAGGVDNQPTMGSLSDETQMSGYMDMKETNPQQARDVALGKAHPQRNDVTAEFVATQEANAAQKAGDIAYSKELANSPVFSETKRKGQEISSLRNLNEHSPVKVIKDLIKARQAAFKNGAKITTDVTDSEAKLIIDKANILDNAKEQFLAESATGVVKPSTRFRYGAAKVEFDKYMHDLAPNKTISQWVKNPWQAGKDIAGTSKSLRATADVSAILRQGLKLWANPTNWGIVSKNTLKSLQVFAKSFGDEAAMDAVNATNASRTNTVNGMAKRMGVEIYGTLKPGMEVIEEAFPNRAVQKIPVLARLYRASDNSYTAFMQLNRGDLMDKYVDLAVKAGVDMTDSTQAKAIGNMVNALSSRGNLGRLEKYAEGVNNVFFSPRNLKANFDVMGGHVLTGGGEAFKFSLKKSDNFVRRQAAKNLIISASTIYSVLKVAEAIRPGSVEWDERSADFGKVKVGKTRFDVTGGMSSLVTLGARMATQSTKSSTTGIVSKLDDPEAGPFGQTTTGVIGTFAENKLSPALAALQDIVAKKDFSGKKPTVGSTIHNLTVPIIVDNYDELSKTKGAAPIVASTILEAFGVSTNTYNIKDDWSVRPTDDQKGFQKVANPTTFKLANQTYNDRFNSWFDEVRHTPLYAKLDDKGRGDLIKKAQEDQRKQVMKEFGYVYKEPKKPSSKTESQNIIDVLQKLGR